MTSMLEDVINHGTGYPNAVIGRPAAGKTGTTSNFRDAWFVGYTPDLVTAVWLGNDNYTPMNESYGGNIPARIWARFMKAALAGTPQHDFPFPADEVAKVAGCGRGYEYFLKGTEAAESVAGVRSTRTTPSPTRLRAAAASLPQPTVPAGGRDPASGRLTPPPTETPARVGSRRRSHRPASQR